MLLSSLHCQCQQESSSAWQCKMYRRGPNTSLLELCILEILPSSSTLSVSRGLVSSLQASGCMTCRKGRSICHLFALFCFDNCCQVSPLLGAILCYKPSQHLVLLWYRFMCERGPTYSSENIVASTVSGFAHTALQLCLPGWCQSLLVPAG